MMMVVRSAALLALLFSSAFAFNAQVTSILTQEPMPDAEEDKNRSPIQKVIALLKDMQKQLQKEGEEDEETYEQLACWCETNDREVTKAVADAEAHIDDLTHKIEEGIQKSSTLNTEIANLEKEIAANQNALDKAAALRKKTLAEFNTEEKDALQSIQALKNAIVVLSKHHGGSLLQISANQMFEVAKVAERTLRTHADLFEGVLTAHQKKSVSKLVQATSKGTYAPQSGEIFGILQAMKETFEQNLSGAQKEESQSQKAFAELKAAKEEEIAAGQQLAEAKTQELADTDEKLANNKQDLSDTRETLSSDEKFLMELKETCAMSDKEYEERVKTRQEELEAVSKCLALFTSDEAHDLFRKTVNPAFVQEGETLSNRRQRAQASKLLSDIARKHQDPRLMTLAVSARLDGFKRVIKAIDDMIAQLTVEKKDEIKHKDYCVQSLFETEGAIEKKERLKKDLTEQIDDLTMTIDTLTKAIEVLKTEIVDLQTAIKRGGEDREKENKAFQLTVADQRATQKLLEAGLTVLKGFYEKKAKAMALAQQQGAARPPPPPGFKEYKKNEKSGGVMGMIQSIINDAKALEAEAVAAENEAQKAYEDFVKDSNQSIEDKSKAIVNKSEEKAKAEEEKTQAEADREDALLELEQLSNENADLHKACDYVLKNFDIRQTARDEEIEALRQAKAILSGAKFIQFVKNFRGA